MKNVVLGASIAVMLTGCGGGGGGTVPDAKIPTPVLPSDGSGGNGLPVVSYPASVSGLNAQVWRDAGYTGSGVKVAVLDTGFTQQSADLKNAVVSSNQVYTISNDQLVATGGTDTQNPDSTVNHGQAMAAIVASKTYGVSPDATLFNGYIGNLANGQASNESIAGAINWALTSANADIVSLSYGADGVSRVTSLAPVSLQNTYNAGLNALVSSDRLLVVGAGNNSSSVTTAISNSESSGYYQNPLHDTNTAKQILVIGALSNGTIASYSNYAGTDKAVQDRMLFANGTIQFSSTSTEIGSSSATASVAGLAAAMKQRWSTLGGAQISNILIQTANRSFSGYDPAVYGKGIIDANAAFSPVGATGVRLTNTDAPVSVSSLSLTLPSGISTKSSISFAAFDSYGRDFTYGTNAKNMPTTMLSDAMAAFTGVRTVEKDGTIMNVSNGYASSESKISNSLSLNGEMSSRGQERFGGISFIGFSNLATSAGMDSLYRSGFSSKLGANESVSYGVMYGEKQTASGYTQSSGVYAGYKVGNVSVAFNALTNPQSLTGNSLLSVENSMLMSTDARYQDKGFFVGAKLDSLNGSGTGMLRSASLNTTTAYAGFAADLDDVWSAGLAVAHKESNGNLGLVLPYGQSSNGDILSGTANIGLSGSDQIVSASLSASLGETKVVTQGMASNTDKGLMIGLMKTW